MVVRVVAARVPLAVLHMRCYYGGAAKAQLKHTPRPYPQHQLGEHGHKNQDGRELSGHEVAREYTGQISQG